MQVVLNTNKNKKNKVIQDESSINEVVKGKWEYRDYEDKASGKTASKAIF